MLTPANPPTRAVPFSPTDGICTPSPRVMGALSTTTARSRRPRPGGGEAAARQVAAAQAARRPHGVGAPRRVPPPNVHPRRFTPSTTPSSESPAWRPIRRAQRDRAAEPEARGAQRRGGPGGDASSSINRNDGGSFSVVGWFASSSRGVAGATGVSSARASRASGPGDGFGFAFDPPRGGPGMSRPKQGRGSKEGGAPRRPQARRLGRGGDRRRGPRRRVGVPGEDARAGGE